MFNLNMEYIIHVWLLYFIQVVSVVEYELMQISFS